MLPPPFGKTPPLLYPGYFTHPPSIILQPPPCTFFALIQSSFSVRITYHLPPNNSISLRTPLELTIESADSTACSSSIFASLGHSDTPSVRWRKRLRGRSNLHTPLKSASPLSEFCQLRYESLGCLGLALAVQLIPTLLLLVLASPLHKYRSTSPFHLEGEHPARVNS